MPSAIELTVPRCSIDLAISLSVGYRLTLRSPDLVNGFLLVDEFAVFFGLFEFDDPIAVR